MNESNYEEIVNLLDRYIRLQRIISSDDPVKEAEDQLKKTEEMLEAAGIPITDRDYLL
ncbi:MAG: hypothetical protein IJ446_07275 [Oscillospiraceae bacterium]|nr:hypothetical protein [Oscillospiraceae bacterium]